MAEYFLDTNILIEILRNNSVVLNCVRRVTLDRHDIRINALSYYETRRGLLSVGQASTLRTFDSFCHIFGVVHLDQAALDRACQIYLDLKKRGQLIEDADILIAAITLANKATLVTDNINHFQRIGTLRVENWMR